uniref:Receptor-like protein 34 n=1 Tax=Elaeis guineensis var. tenera TaxID=51953 RepID=A0A6I9QIX9_ELAGV|nr:receptor-like protein 34 [Elaeis guineensis]
MAVDAEQFDLLAQQVKGLVEAVQAMQQQQPQASAHPERASPECQNPAAGRATWTNRPILPGKTDPRHVLERSTKLPALSFRLPTPLPQNFRLRLRVRNGPPLERQLDLHLLQLGCLLSEGGRNPLNSAPQGLELFRIPGGHKWRPVNQLPLESDNFVGRPSESPLVVFHLKALYAYPTDHLLLMSAIDLSANKLTGNIPPEIGNLHELVQLNLSHNQLTGPIPEAFSKLNQLSGVIPRQLAQLHFLEVFLVAYNNLSGCTLDFKGEFATFGVSSYEGNIGLHGPPLEQTCTFDSNPTVEVEENQDNSNVEDDIIFFAILAASFVTGFWGCIAFLLCHHTGQHIHSILDDFVDSLTPRILMAAHKQTCVRRNRK